MQKCYLVIFTVFLSIQTAFAKVDESTGIMVFSEKLASIGEKTLSVDLNLQYSAGIPINQHASWVGLGFDLPIPYIERIPQGSVDEKTGNFYCNGTGFYSQKTYRKLITETSNGYSLSPSTGDFTNQQDIYNLNAPFASGRIGFAGPDNSTFTSDYQTDEIIVVSGTWQVGDKILMEGGGLPMPFQNHQNHEYFIVQKAENRIKLSQTSGGQPIDIILPLQINSWVILTVDAVESPIPTRFTV